MEPLSGRVAARTPVELFKGILKQRARDEAQAAGWPVTRTFTGPNGVTVEGKIVASVKDGRIMYNYGAKHEITLGGEVIPVRFMGNELTPLCVSGFGALRAKYLGSGTGETEAGAQAAMDDGEE